MDKTANTKKDFPEILKKKMENKNITKAELARKVDVSDTTIGRYIKGTMRPRQLILNRLADALDCSVKEF